MMSNTKKTADKADDKEKQAAKATEINDTFGGSPVTTGIGARPAEETEENRPKTFDERALDASIGLIHVEGIGYEYVGVTPARDKTKLETDDGFPITPRNTTFRPLSEVPFDVSRRVKDQKTGDYYFPAASARGWADVSYKGNPLVPAE